MVRVEPGKSVCSQDVTNVANNMEIEDPLEVYQDGEPGTEDTDEPDLPQFTQLDFQGTEEDNTSAQENNNNEELDKEDFVIVAFKTQKTTIHFIGKILRKDEDSYYEVKFLRKRKKAFIFPDENDISHVRRNEIVKVLQQPECPSSSREIFYFQEDLSKFKIN